LQFYYSPNRRKLALDSVEQKDAKAYLQVARVVFFGNSDIDLVRGGSEDRRRFLDFVGSQLDSSYREILRSYERALRSRNAYLKMSPARFREIAAYTGPLLKYGYELTSVRARVLERLEPFALSAFNQISDQAETFALRYEAGATNDFAAALAATREEEQRLRTTVVGPQRDDVQFVMHGQRAELFASEGQQRTMALAVKLGQARLLEAEFDQPPILLLDDIFGELDRERRNRLLQALAGRSQRIVTATTLDWLSGSFSGLGYELRESGESERVLVGLPTS
jgi:DNA replication and repair protein RecF